MNKKNQTVILRKITESDLTNLATLANNEKVSINVRDGFPHPYTLADARNFYEMLQNHKTMFAFAIEYQGEYVGNISLVQGTDVYRKSAEIGYFIGEPFWGKGIATQAVNMMVDYGFSNLDIVRIHTGVFEYNIASQKVLEKCGFIKEAVFEKSIIKKGILYNEIRYAKLKKE